MSDKMGEFLTSEIINQMVDNCCTRASLTAPDTQMPAVDRLAALLATLASRTVQTDRELKSHMQWLREARDRETQITDTAIKEINEAVRLTELMKWIDKPNKKRIGQLQVLIARLNDAITKIDPTHIPF